MCYDGAAEMRFFRVSREPSPPAPSCQPQVALAPLQWSCGSFWPFCGAAALVLPAASESKAVRKHRENDCGASVARRLGTRREETFAVQRWSRRISVTGEAGRAWETNHGRRRKGRTSRYAAPNRLCGFQVDSWGGWVYGFRPRAVQYRKFRFNSCSRRLSPCQAV